MKDNMLEVGDVLYTYERWGNGPIKSIVKSVTPKRSKAGYLEVHREVREIEDWGSTKKIKVVKLVGHYGDAQLETPELLAEWEADQLKKKAAKLINGLHIYQLTTPQHKQLIELIESFTPKIETP